MNLTEIIQNLKAKPLTETRDFSEIEIEGGYASDLLSCVIAGAKSQNIWVTLIANMNIVAVATLAEIPAIIITESAQPDSATIARANSEGIVLLSTSMTNFQTIGQMWELGVKVI